MSQESNINSDVDEFEEITYNGKDYFLDDEDIVLEMTGDGVFIPIGKLIKRDPIQIDFSGAKHLALNVDYETDDSEFSENNSDLESDEEESESDEDEDEEDIEFEDIEFNGITYTVDNDNDVFIESDGDYEYVGILISKTPVKIDFFIDYHGISYLLNEKTKTVLDKKTKQVIGKQFGKIPLKFVFFKPVDLVEPLIKISPTLSADKKKDVYEGTKQIGFLIKIDNALRNTIELKKNQINPIGEYQIVLIGENVYILVTKIPSTEKEFIGQLKHMEGLLEEVKKEVVKRKSSLLPKVSSTPVKQPKSVSPKSQVESPKQEKNELDDDETVDMSEIEYLGKPYVVDMSTKEVYEKNEAHDDYHLVGKLEKNGSVRFINKANWLDEYEDIEKMMYKGTEYMVNPNTKNVFLLNKHLDEYEHVGEVITLSPLKIRLQSDDFLGKSNQNNVDLEEESDEKEEDDEMVEVEIIESYGKKFIRDAEQNVYEPKRFELIGTWDSEDDEIDYIPNRGFLNIDNSCYLDSVLFALFYRNSSFINGSILRKDIDSMMRKLRINKPDVIVALKQNQSELLRLYKWLHYPETTVDDIKVCQNFRAIYKQVSLEKNAAAIKVDGFEKELGDSAEFLFGLFNGFGIKTLIKEMTSIGKNGEEVREIVHIIEETAPIITVGVKAKPEQYYNNEIISTESQGKMLSTVMKMSSEDEEVDNELQGRIKIEQIKILLEFFKTKTRVVKQDKTRMTSRIEEIGKTKKFSDSQLEEIKQIFSDLYTKVLPKELKTLLLDTSDSIIPLKSRLTELQDRYRFQFAEKIDRTTYRSIDGTDHYYMVINVDRGLQSGKSLVRDKTAFDVRETILCPRGEKIHLQFVVKYIDSPKHYVCYFKNIDDDLWYLYNDLNRSFRIVSSSAQDKQPGTFEKMKAETATGCTLLFYNK